MTVGEVGLRSVRVVEIGLVPRSSAQERVEYSPRHVCTRGQGEYSTGRQFVPASCVHDSRHVTGSGVPVSRGGVEYSPRHVSESRPGC